MESLFYMDAIHDENRIKVWLGVSSVDGVTLVPIQTDPSTGAMAMEIGVSTMPVMADLKSYLYRDQNFYPILGGQSSASSSVVLPVSVNPSTGAVMAQTT